jgi:hypothetical protein
MTSEKRGVFQFIGVANLIVCALFLILSLPFFWGQFRVLRWWPVTQAQITRSEVVTQPAAKHDQLYAAKLEIRYTVSGSPVTVELISFQSSNYENTVRRAGDFPAGSWQPVRYDPSHPSQARIGAGWNRRFFAVPLITLGVGLIFGGLATGFFIAARLQPTP